jgi:hypothetical protein
MTLAIFLVIAAVLSLVVILRVAVSRNLQISSDSQLAAQIQPIDLDAFRNLADPAEDEYLRRKLPQAEYRHVQRLRLKAMAAYVQIAAQNAALLIQMGQSALSSSNVEATTAARGLINDALLLRRNATFAMFKIYIAWTWPNAGVAAGSVLDGYQQLSGSAMLLGRLQNPSAPVRISAAL